MTSELTPRPQATIAIPVFNSAGTLPRCLRSAMAQSLRDIEILVADDGSTDASASVVEQFVASDSRIRLIRMERNGGKSRAMNRLAQEARGTWFAVLDADDAYCSQRLEQLIGAAETAGVEMAADNIYYVDAGVDHVIQTAFPRDTPTRIVTKCDLAKNANSFATFDFGLLKPVIRHDFLLTHGLYYYEGARLSEDFYYLMNFFVAGGRGCIISQPLYKWTLPFGPVSRRWTQTGNGAWRYDYRNALQANRHFTNEMTQRNEPEIVTMLRKRERQYTSMMYYVDAQRLAADGRPFNALRAVLIHPCTYRLLSRSMARRCVWILRRTIGLQT